MSRLFGTDGIRGNVGEFPLLPDFVLRLGFATGTVLLHKTLRPTVVIGRDTRYSGPALQNALTAGLLSSGISVIDAGVITTPGVAYLARRLDAEAGVVVSASHNPVDENGIKFFDGKGFKLSETLEQEIETLLDEPAPWGTRTSRHFGRCIDGREMRELYVEDLVREHSNLQLDQMTVVMDCANGAASWPAPECFARLGAKIIAIHAAPTGLNINEKAGSEYVRRNPENMISLIRQYKADFGLAFDGDADRVIFVDQETGIIDGDHMLAILAQHLDQHRHLLGRTIVATTMRNSGLLKYIEASGLKYIETKVGDKYVVEKLADLARASHSPETLALGGEQAGHIVLLDDQHTTGDGIRTALYMVRALLESKAASLAELARCLQKTPQVIASAAVNDKPPLDGIKELNALRQKAKSDLSGLQRMELRYSGTEPLFRAMLEADERHSESELANVAWAICRAVQNASGTVEGRIEILNCTRGGMLFAQT